jgi:hypothetical protein
MSNLSPIWKKAYRAICDRDTYSALPLIPKLQEREELQLKNKAGYTLLHYAIITNNIEICYKILMLNNNTSSDILDKFQIPPLFLAVQISNYGICKLLIEFNKDIVNYTLPTKETVYLNDKIESTIPSEFTILDSALVAARVSSTYCDLEWKVVNKEIYQLILKHIDKKIIISHLKKLKNYMFNYCSNSRNEPYNYMINLLEECLNEK